MDEENKNDDDIGDGVVTPDANSMSDRVLIDPDRQGSKQLMLYFCDLLDENPLFYNCYKDQVTWLLEQLKQSSDCNYLGQLVGLCLSGSARFEVLHDISVAVVFVVVPRTGFHGSAGAFGAFVVTGSISSVEPEDANQQHCYYPHIIDLCW